ncbi:hypothetical protein G6F46_014817 [Rhizopus delemar]|nr:hypothetical protein G6F46_014817 [Rhizopus delemar]
MRIRGHVWPGPFALRYRAPVAGRNAAARGRPHQRPGAGVRARLGMGNDPPPACGRYPGGARTRLAGHALLRARRGRADGADLGGAGRPGRTPAGAEDE